MDDEAHADLKRLTLLGITPEALAQCHGLSKLICRELGLHETALDGIGLRIHLLQSLITDVVAEATQLALESKDDPKQGYPLVAIGEVLGIHNESAFAARLKRLGILENEWQQKVRQFDAPKLKRQLNAGIWFKQREKINPRAAGRNEDQHLRILCTQIALRLGVHKEAIGRKILAGARDSSTHVDTPQEAVSPRTTESREISDVHKSIQDSQAEWLAVREELAESRARLAYLAAEVYPEQLRLEGTGFLLPSGWKIEPPAELSTVRLRLELGAAEPVVSSSPPYKAVLPLADSGVRFHRYTAALKELINPKQMSNKPCWRLKDFVNTPSGPLFTFGECSYFDCLNVGESLAHETAIAARKSSDENSLDHPTMAIRRLIGGSDFLANRSVVCAISTLIIRNSAEAPTFLLHERSKSKVATAGGMLQVVPSGTFQQASPYNHGDDDFDFWKNIMREYSEELFGDPEHAGDDRVNYDGFPFSELNTERAEGRVQLYLLGLGFDALTLWGEILTVAVFNPDAYDRQAKRFVEDTDEGSGLRDYPFTREQIDKLISSRRLAPAGAACLTLAWESREHWLA